MDAEERALLASVTADPDDDTARLVYADWLQEHGREERAEFIRVQVELFALVLGAPATPARSRYDALTQRERELLQAHARQWHADFAARVPENRLTHFNFRRGIIGSVDCPPKYFRENAGALVEAAPFERLRLIRPTPRTMQGVVSDPNFKRFRALELDADEVKAEVLQTLLNADLRHLRRLAVAGRSSYRIPPPAWVNRSAELVERIAASGALAGLDTLDLRNCGIGGRGASALATSHALAGLRILLLTGNGLPGEDQARLRARYGPRAYFDFPDYQDRLTIGDLR